MNRAQRRAYQKSLPAYKKMGHEKLMNAIAKNGLTVEDLKKCKAEGYQLGVESAVMQCYAAFCLALNEQFGFGRERVLRALKAADDKVIFAVDSAEMVDEVFARFGIRMDFRDGLERVQEA
jgi:hypothetical protein